MIQIYQKLQVNLYLYSCATSPSFIPRAHTLIMRNFCCAGYEGIGTSWNKARHVPASKAHDSGPHRSLLVSINIYITQRSFSSLHYHGIGNTCMRLPQVLGMAGWVYCNPFSYPLWPLTPLRKPNMHWQHHCRPTMDLPFYYFCKLTPQGFSRPWTLPSAMIWNSSKVPQRQRTSPTRPTSLEPRRVASAEDASRVRVYPFRLDQNIVRGPSAISISSSSQKTMAEPAS